MEQAGRSLKGQLKHAGRIDAGAVVVVGAEELRVRDVRAGEERAVLDVSEAVEMLADQP